MLLPKPGPLPQTSQLAATGHSQTDRPRSSGVQAFTVDSRQFRADDDVTNDSMTNDGVTGSTEGFTGPTWIGQPEQHTTATPVH